jgi:hypothetical protein
MTTKWTTKTTKMTLEMTDRRRASEKNQTRLLPQVGGTNQQKGCFLGILEFVKHAVRIGVAAFANLANMNLVHGGPKCPKIKFLCGEEWEELGWSLGTCSCPHLIRAYNLQSFVMMQACLKESVDEHGRHYPRRSMTEAR